MFPLLSNGQDFVRIGNIEIQTKDLGEMTYSNAKNAIKDLGEGWRLPNEKELILMFNSQDKIGSLSRREYKVVQDYWIYSGNYLGEENGQLVLLRTFIDPGYTLTYNKSDTDDRTFKFIRAVRDASAVKKVVAKNLSNFKSSGSNQTQNSCNFKFIIPKITWKLVDNRRKCSYCRAQYVPYSKVDLAEAKQIHAVQYLQGKLLKHWDAVNASDEHKESDRDKLRNVFRKNNYSEVAILNAQLQEMIAPGIKSAINAKRAMLDNSLDNYYDFNTIYLYDVEESKYCSRKCENKDY
jgi:hypothetical protein